MEKLQAEQHTWGIKPWNKEGKVEKLERSSLSATHSVSEERCVPTWSVSQRRCLCGYVSWGLHRANTPLRSTHGLQSGSSRAGSPGKDAVRHWSLQRSSFHKWGWTQTHKTLPINSVLLLLFSCSFGSTQQRIPNYFWAIKLFWKPSSSCLYFLCHRR